MSGSANSKGRRRRQRRRSAHRHRREDAEAAVGARLVARGALLEARDGALAALDEAHLYTAAGRSALRWKGMDVGKALEDWWHGRAFSSGAVARYSSSCGATISMLGVTE